MKLEWMKQYRDLIEKFIRYGNAYAKFYEKQYEFGTQIKFSAAQIQTLEYILENENQNMSEIAKRLGVSKSTFTRNVNKLMDKNLLEKHKTDTNQKDIYLHINEYGKKIYNEYTKYINTVLFDELFKLANQVPEEYLEIIKEMLDYASNALIDIREM